MVFLGVLRVGSYVRAPARAAKFRNDASNASAPKQMARPASRPSRKFTGDRDCRDCLLAPPWSKIALLPHDVELARNEHRVCVASIGKTEPHFPVDVCAEQILGRECNAALREQLANRMESAI